MIDLRDTAILTKKLIPSRGFPEHLYPIDNRNESNVAPDSSIVMNRENGICNNRANLVERPSPVHNKIERHLNLKHERPGIGVITWWLQLNVRRNYLPCTGIGEVSAN